MTAADVVRLEADVGKVRTGVDDLSRRSAFAEDVLLCRCHRAGRPVAEFCHAGQKGKVAERACDVFQAKGHYKHSLKLFFHGAILASHFIFVN